MTKQKTCILSGGTGYVGRYLLEALTSANWKVILLSRAKTEGVILFSLGDKLHSDYFEGCDLLIHCAYDFTKKSSREIYKTNVEGSRLLFEAAKKGGVKKCLFISSIASFKKSTSIYGKSKFLIEKELDFPVSVIVRPGLVFGRENVGTYRMIENWVKNLPFIPLLSGGSLLYACHMDDLSAYLAKEADACFYGHSFSKTEYAGHSTPVSFINLIRQMKKNIGVKKLVIPVPWRVLWLMIKILERLKIPFPFRSDSIVALVNYNKDIHIIENSKRGITFRNFF